MSIKQIKDMTAQTSPARADLTMIQQAADDSCRKTTVQQLAHAAAGATAFSSPADPTGTTDATGKMMGLAGSITPLSSGKLKITITGMIANNTIGDGASVQIRYGTGGAPANAAALTGTALGALKNFVASTAAGKQGFSLCAIVTGLTLATAYWVDVGLKAVTGGTASLYDIDIVIEEYP